MKGADIYSSYGLLLMQRESLQDGKDDAQNSAEAGKLLRKGGMYEVSQVEIEAPRRCCQRCIIQSETCIRGVRGG